MTVVKPFPTEAEVLDCFPAPFLDDLIKGRVLPIVGAGLSKNAITPGNEQLPLWDEMGRLLSDEMKDYPFSGSLDAISAYSHEFGRTRLVERMTELLLVHSAKPGSPHEAFCNLPFSLVCTTNFDFLLEQQYLKNSRFCRPIIDEEQLSIAGRDSDVVLLKLHGDLHHPQRLVVTEDDYSRFLDTFPLLATYLANLLISRTPLLIGYSLDDPDFRQVWQVVNDRLGRLRRSAYAIAVDASSSDISRFARRGVRLISLPGSKSNYPEILALAFTALRNHWSKNIHTVSQVVQEESFEQLLLPPEAKTRLCFFSVPVTLLSYYREHAFPLAERHGFIPISANDMISPGDNVHAKTETLIQRSEIVVVDASSRFNGMELDIALSKMGKERLFIILEESSKVPSDLSNRRYVMRQSLPSSDSQPFLEELEEWFSLMANQLRGEYDAEPQKLLDLGQPRAAVLSAITLLEVRLADVVEKAGGIKGRYPHTIGKTVAAAHEHGLLTQQTVDEIQDWMRLRNLVAHSVSPVTHEQALAVVDGVKSVFRELSKPKTSRTAKKGTTKKKSAKKKSAQKKRAKRTKGGR